MRAAADGVEFAPASSVKTGLESIPERLGFYVWLVAMIGFLVWLIAFGVNV